MSGALVWTGKLAAWLAFIACTVAAVVAWTVHAWIALAAAACIALAAVKLALVADRRIVGERLCRNAQQLQAWNGTEITAPLRRAKWLASTGLMASFTSVGVVGLAAGPWRVPPVAIAMAAVVTLFGWVFLGILAMGVSAMRAGYALRLDPAGIHYGRSPTIPWRDVQAVDVETVAAKGAVSHLLAVVLQPQAVRAWPRQRAAAWLGGLRLRGGRVRVPLGFAAVDPGLLLEATRVIAGRAGVPLGRGWPASTGALASRRLGNTMDPGADRG